MTHRHSTVLLHSSGTEMLQQCIETGTYTAQSVVTRPARCSKGRAAECIITRAAQKNDNGHTAQVKILPALLHSIPFYSILFNSDQAMGWTVYRKRSWDSSTSIMTTVKFLVGGRDLSCLLNVPTSSAAHWVSGVLFMVVKQSVHKDAHSPGSSNQG